MTFKLIWFSNGLIEKYSDYVTGHDMNEANALVVSDYRFDTLRWIIADFRNACVTLEITEKFEEAAAMAYASSLTNNHIVIAVVVSDPVTKLSALQFSKFDQPYPYKVCSTMDEACEWIKRTSTYNIDFKDIFLT